MFKLYNTWKCVKDIFIKPELSVYFGRWENDPNLPVWRNGPAVYICNKKKLRKLAHVAKQGVFITAGTKKYKFGEQELDMKVKEFTSHTLPKGIKAGDYVWNRTIRKKLRKWHLGWVKPIMYLPKFFRFRIINSDVYWKTKWDSIQYEYPPQLSFIGFGLSLTFTLHCPMHNKFSSDDSYWESILTHIYDNTSGELKETIDKTGIWHSIDDNTFYFATRPTYIVAKKQDEYYAAVSELKTYHIDKTVF